MRINRNQFNRTGAIKRALFHYKRAKGHLVPYIRNRFIWHYFPRFGRVSEFPDHVDVEISTLCNMSCPMCYRRTGEFKSRVKQCFMDFSLFRKIIDECARNRAFSIKLSLRGESFMHPEVTEMISYAKRSGIKEVSSLTNLLALDEGLFEKLVKLGMDWLTISFDGLTDKYEAIRKPAKFAESYEKVKKFSEIKKSLKSHKPALKIQTIWPAIKDEPEAFFDAFAPYADHITINPLIDYLHRDRDIEYEENFTCPALWQRFVIGSDGRALLCANDEMGKEIIGDVNTQTIKEIWHGPKLEKIRRLHAAGLAHRELEVCRECHFPRKLIRKTVKIGGRVYRIKQYTNRPDEIGK